MNMINHGLEERFLKEYFRFAININIYGVAPYFELSKAQSKKLDAFDEMAFKAVAVNVHRLVHESYENLAEFLHALIARKDKGVSLFEYLGNVSQKPKTIPKISKIEDADSFLANHGLPVNEKEIGIKMQPGGFDQFKGEIERRLIKLFKLIPIAQDANSAIYNTTKHSKAWVSSAREFVNDESAPDTPMAIVVKEGHVQDKWVSIPFDRESIQREMLIIQGVAVAMRDLLLMFTAKYYPNAAEQMLQFPEVKLITEET